MALAAHDASWLSVAMLALGAALMVQGIGTYGAAPLWEPADNLSRRRAYITTRPPI